MNIKNLTLAVAVALAVAKLVGNAVPFAVDPLPPHLGLDGISNEIRFVN